MTRTQQQPRSNTDMRRLAHILGADADHMERRILQEIVAEATSAYWTRRAAEFKAVGNERCDEVARACANAAAYWRWARNPEDVTLRAAT